MKLKKLLLECAKCEDQCKIEKVMKARFGDKVKIKSVERLTELDLKVCRQIYKDIRKDYVECMTKLDNLAHSLRQLGQFLGVYDKKEKKK